MVGLAAPPSTRPPRTEIRIAGPTPKPTATAPTRGARGAALVSAPARGSKRSASAPGSPPIR
jgi:hypothetical protein